MNLSFFLPVLMFVLLSLQHVFSANNTNDFQFVSPLPGSENNARESTIIIRHGKNIDQTSFFNAGLFDVTGSESGQIKGDVVLSSDAKTVIFKPFQKFIANETVVVILNNGLKSRSGENLPACEFSFKVTPFGKQPNPYDYIDDIEERYPVSGISGKKGFGKALNPGDFPDITVDIYDSSAVGEGYIYMAVASEVPGIGYYLMILNNDGTPVFSRELLDDYSYDFKVQPNGQMTYAQFLEHHSYTGGGNVIHMVMDNSFTIVDSFQMGNGYIAEAHDFQLLPNGHALLFGYYLTRVDMSRIVPGGYPNALVSGGVVQELDSDKNVIFQWRTWDYYDFETYPYNPRFATRPIVSAFHLNTINMDSDGQIIIATPRWVKKINRQTGDIMWNLGGFDNEFSFVGVDSTSGVDYVGGHMFYRIPNGNYLIYDNGNRQGTRSSKSHEFSLNEQNKTAELIWSYVPDTTIAAWHRGNAQRLPNGNTFIGWGGASGDRIPACTEVTPAGQKVFEISFDNPGVESYRAFRFPLPDGLPSAEVTITEVAPGNTYNFSSGGSNNTGVSVRINSMGGSGYNEMTVKKYDYAPLNPLFLGKAPRVKPARMVLSRYNISSINADVMFDVNNWEISEPDSSIIYWREFEGDGLFIALPTSYNPATQKVVANNDRFGEYIITRPDLASIVFTPWPIKPADSSTVNQNLSVTLSWTPVGFVNEYDLQVALDDNFSNIIINRNNMTNAYFTIDTLIADTTYFWRVKSYNEAGSSSWTAPQMFTTIPPYVSVIAPNGGEMWQRGLEYFIQTDDNITENLVLELYENQSVVSLIDTVESNGAYKWEIPFGIPAGHNYLIQIKSVTDSNLSDISDNVFSVIDTVTGINSDQETIIKNYMLHQNYPNPFNPETTIGFELIKDTHVTIEIYNMLGQKIEVLVNAQKQAGFHSVDFDGKDLPSGVYIYNFRAGEYKQLKKMVLMK